MSAMIQQAATEIFVTYVANEGPLLRLWAQLERTQATFVERLILQLTEQFERGMGISTSVEVGQLCCARYNDGVYYRARITGPPDITLGRVPVHFIDYGNSEEVSVRDIRSLEGSMLTPLASVTDQATDFFLAGVIPMSGKWDEASLNFIRQTICYEELKCVVVGKVINKKLLKVFYNNEDFAQFLIAKKVGVAVSIHAQQILLQGWYGLNSIPPQIPGFIVPPPVQVTPTPSNLLMNQLHQHSQVVSVTAVPPVRMENVASQLTIAPVVRETVRVFTSPVLEQNSEHKVYVSYVEDGPSSFSVQLQAAEEALASIMHDLNTPQPIPLSQPLMPGSVCLGRFTEDQTLCRSVVMAVLDDKCRLYYVDFGNSEVLPYSQIFELPQQFIIPKVMALRFTLAGLKNLTITEDLKSYFKDIVTEKLLCLRVVPPEGPPLKQYGELYFNGTNVLDLLKQKIKEKQLASLKYVTPLLQIGTRDSVRVSYVIDTSKFYVQSEASSEALGSVMLAVDAVCSGTANQLTPNQLKVGLPCCAKYNEDGKWYRARITSISPDMIDVMYVDYGNSDRVALSSLKSIDPNLVTILNTQAILCCLNGFQDISDESIAIHFEEITLEKSLVMIVMDNLQNDTIVVDLYDSSSGTQVNISSMLSSTFTPETCAVQDQTAHPVEKFPVYDTPVDDGWESLLQKPVPTQSKCLTTEEEMIEKNIVYGEDAVQFNQGTRSSRPQFREALPSLKG